MKKIILFVVSLFPLWGLGGLFAQTIHITPVTADYSKKTVTFVVEWEGTTVPSDRVWVWIDICSAKGETPAWFAPATLTAAAPAGSVDEVSLNGRGFFVTQNPATVTATLNTTLSKFNWCAYGSGAPPKALLNEDGSYTLHGTPPFTINGNIPVPDHTFAAGTCITTLTDLTGNPAGIAPTVLINTTSPAALCGEGDVTLSATASGGTTTAMTYTWMVDGGAAQTTSTGSLLLPSVAVGSMTYSVTVTNAAGCTAEVKTGNITVSGIPTITHASGSTYQTVVACTAMDDIKYNTTNASGVTVIGLPTPVSGSLSSGVYTISGNPTVVGTYNYSVTATNSSGCKSDAASGSITVIASTKTTTWTYCSSVTAATDAYTGKSHSGFTEITNECFAAPESLTWPAANAACATIGSGWRLPVYTELQCICRNRSRTSGLTVNNIYWSSSNFGHYTNSFKHRVRVGNNKCVDEGAQDAVKLLTRCVK